MKNVFSVRVLTTKIIERILFDVWVYYKISCELAKYLCYVKENLIKII